MLSKPEAGRHKVLMDREAFVGRINAYCRIAQRIRAAAAAQNPDIDEITITKKLIAEENGHAIKTRIPGTWGENARYVWLGKDKAMEIHDGKSILTFLERGKDYKIYSEDNRVVGTMKGKDLYEGHYDRVSAQVRKRHADLERKAREQGHARGKKAAPQKTPAPQKR